MYPRLRAADLFWLCETMQVKYVSQWHTQGLRLGMQQAANRQEFFLISLTRENPFLSS
jgi:hypothetical protein